MDESLTSDDNCDVRGNFFLNEASKLVQLELEKEFALSEKDKIIQEATDTINSLKSNITQLQVEYEQLDQNYQKEISYREEVLKRIETTRSMCDSAAHYSNILATSIKELDDDKLKIAEFYNEIYKRQEETEEKRKKLDLTIKEQVDVLERGILQVALEKEMVMEQLSSLRDVLSQAENKLRYETEQKIGLESEIERYKTEISKMRSSLETEHANAIKYRIIQAHLRKKMSELKAIESKKFNSLKVLYNKKIKSLGFQMRELKQKLNESEDNALKYSDLIEEMERLNENLNQKLQEISGSSAHTDEKLALSMSENVHLLSKLEQLENNLKDQTSKNDDLMNRNQSLKCDYDRAMTTLEEKESELTKLLNANSLMKIEVEEYRIKVQASNDIDKMRPEDREELEGRISNMKNKLLDYSESEKELRKEIELLNETLSQERSNFKSSLYEQHACIQNLEKEVSELKLQKINVEEELKVHIEFIKQKEKKLQEYMKLESDWKKDLESKIAVNCALEANLKDTEEIIKSLRNEIAEAERNIQSREKKLKNAEEEILIMKNKSEILSANEAAMDAMKKSLESAEANVEAYKSVINKLENEVTVLKSSQDRLIKDLKSDIYQAEIPQREIQTSSNFFTTPRQLYTGVKKEVSSRNKKESSCQSDPSKKNTSRRLLSTPTRLLEDSNLPSTSKALLPEEETRDPFEFDSDSSTEQLNAQQVLKAFKVVQKKDSSSARRRK